MLIFYILLIYESYILILIYLERAMAHCGSSEVLIVGGVGCTLFCILISLSAEHFVFLVVNVIEYRVIPTENSCYRF